MRIWLKRIRGTVGMGLTWAVGWALVGLLVGIASKLLPFLPWDAFFRVFDAPLPALAIPGFIGGALFSIVLGIAGRRRLLHELSLVQIGLWGALGGALLSLIPAAMAGLGLATVNESEWTVWRLTATIGVPLTVLSALSASVSLALARKANDNERISARNELWELDAVAEHEFVDGHSFTPNEAPAKQSV